MTCFDSQIGYFFGHIFLEIIPNIFVDLIRPYKPRTYLSLCKFMFNSKILRILSQTNLEIVMENIHQVHDA